MEGRPILLMIAKNSNRPPAHSATLHFLTIILLFPSSTSQNNSLTVIGSYVEAALLGEEKWERGRGQYRIDFLEEMLLFYDNVARISS